MSAIEFLDSNVLVYAYSQTDPGKQSIAHQLVRRTVTGEIVISTQVLAEFASIMLHKVRPIPEIADLLVALRSLTSARIVLPDDNIVRRAVEAHVQYGIHFYDGMIVAAAERAGCARILSEDMSAGQKYFGIEVANPFAKP